jgi:hypothetical protein
MQLCFDVMLVANLIFLELPSFELLGESEVRFLRSYPGTSEGGTMPQSKNKA